MPQDRPGARDTSPSQHMKGRAGGRLQPTFAQAKPSWPPRGPVTSPHHELLTRTTDARAREAGGSMANALTRRTVGPVVMREPEQIAAQRVALGRCLASHREQSGLSQQGLAERLYYDRTSICKIETGQQPAP